VQRCKGRDKLVWRATTKVNVVTGVVATQGKRVESESANGGRDQEKGADHDANDHAAGVVS
jgi:hypothetical protein